MTRRTAWRIRWRGAAAAAAAVALLLLLPLVALGQGLPSGPPLPTLPPGTTPTPTPAPSSCASPAPSPSPSPRPSTCPTASSSPAPGSSAGAGPAQSPAASPTPGAAVMLPAGTGALITDPALVNVLDSVLSQPVHLDPPALRHFLEAGGPAGGSNADGSPSTPGTAASTPRGGNPMAFASAALVTALALGSALAVLLLAAGPLIAAALAGLPRLRLRRLPAPRRALHLTVGVSAIAAAALVMGLATATAPRGAVSAASVGAPPLRAAATGIAASMRSPADTSPWSELLAIEVGVAARQQQLTLEENRITILAENVTGHLEPPARGSGADRRITTPDELDALLAAHAQTVAVYQQSLQREYDFYVSAAQDPAVRSALDTAASRDRTVASVVAYDLEEVSTQLEQEQAIAAAQAAEAAQAQQEIAANSSAPKFTAPVGGVVSQGFGPTNFAMEPSLTYHGVFYTHFHTGIDIANSLDTPVAAAAPGRVILAGTSRDSSGNVVGYGNYVVIDHGGGWISLYGHLDKLAVTTGQLVQRGQEIGLLGSTGWSTGPHLHFEIRHGGDLIDPETLLGNAVRK